ncbi:MAG: hypothetical protein KC912_00205 [Proteobacteria bacterium]|nr:hypothetical protein [Pseudomonadota bacterium]
MIEHIEPYARLGWTEKRGFELDLAANEDGVLVRMTGVPVAADGTDALTANAIELHRLEILFKADVDISGTPGQLQEATIQIRGSKLAFTAKIEDAETGESQDFASETALQVAVGAPKAGGKIAASVEEEELDWEDENTLEQLFGDVMPMSTSEVRKPKPEPGPAGGGFAALLKALAGADPDGHHATQEVARPSPAPFQNDPLPDLEPPSPAFSVEQEAKSFLALLLEHEHLELVEGHTMDELVSGLAPLLAAGVGPVSKASALSNWFLEQDAVEELYIDDESLAGLLEAW